MKKAFLQKLLSNFIYTSQSCRTSMDLLFKRKLSKPKDARNYFFQVLLGTSQLYVSALILGRELSQFDLKREKPKRTKKEHDGIRFGEVSRVNNLRLKYRERLEQLACWNYFNGTNAFSEFTRLSSSRDYVNKFTLHLPEIYEEAIRSENYAKHLQRAFDGGVAARLIVSLEHLTRNHISFVHFALEWAADESSW